MKLIMENWRKFTEQVDKETQFFGRDYDKNPLTDEEIALLAQDDDDGLNARAQLIAHIYDYQELPDMSPTMQLKSKKSDPEKQEVSDRAFEMLAQTAEKHGQEISDTGVDRTATGTATQTGKKGEKPRDTAKRASVDQYEGHGYTPYPIEAYQKYNGDQAVYTDEELYERQLMEDCPSYEAGTTRGNSSLTQTCGGEERTINCWSKTIAKHFKNSDGYFDAGNEFNMMAVKILNESAHSFKVSIVDPAKDKPISLLETFIKALKAQGAEFEITTKNGKSGIEISPIVDPDGNQPFTKFCPTPQKIKDKVYEKSVVIRPRPQNGPDTLVTIAIPRMSQGGDSYDVTIEPIGETAGDFTWSPGSSGRMMIEAEDGRSSAGDMYTQMIRISPDGEEIFDMLEPERDALNAEDPNAYGRAFRALEREPNVPVKVSQQHVPNADDKKINIGQLYRDMLNSI